MTTQSQKELSAGIHAQHKIDSNAPKIEYEDSDSDDFVVFDDDDEDDAYEQGYASGRSKEKAMNAMIKAGTKRVPQVSRVTIRNSKTKLHVFKKPDVYWSPTSNKFVICGEAELVDLKFPLQADKDLSNNVTVTGKNVELDPNDIELVMNQADVSSEQAVKALKAADGDIISALVEVASYGE